MKLFFLLLSVFFHTVATATVVWLGSCFPPSGSLVQKGSGSIEVGLVVPGQEGLLKFDTDDLDLMRPPVNFQKRFVSSLAMKSEESVWEEGVREDFEWQLQEEKRRIPSIAVRMPLDSGALTETLGDSGNPPPRYPRVAILRGWEGETVVRISLDLSGVVKDAKVIRSSGHSILDRAVLEVLPKWRLKNVRNSRLEIPFKFVLTSNPKLAREPRRERLGQMDLKKT